MLFVVPFIYENSLTSERLGVVCSSPCDARAGNCATFPYEARSGMMYDAPPAADNETTVSWTQALVSDTHELVTEQSTKN